MNTHNAKVYESDQSHFHLLPHFHCSDFDNKMWGEGFSLLCHGAQARVVQWASYGTNHLLQQVLWWEVWWRGGRGLQLLLDQPWGAPAPAAFAGEKSRLWGFLKLASTCGMVFLLHPDQDGAVGTILYFIAQNVYFYTWQCKRPLFLLTFSPRGVKVNKDCDLLHRQV